MTVTFFSNFLNDHQLPFCESLIDNIGIENFRFVAHAKMDYDRVEMGFEDMNVTKPFVVRTYENEESFLEAQRLMLDSDVVIIGSSVNMPIEERLRSKKITFRYNERLLKQGDWRLLDPRVRKEVDRSFIRYKSIDAPLYVLCASAYTSRDLRLFGFPTFKCLKWGYFPAIRHYDNISGLIENKYKDPKIKILWVGRFIDYKHPEVPVKIAKRLLKDGVNFHLNMIGNGPMIGHIDKYIKKNKLSNNVSLLGAQNPDVVRTYMEHSSHFIFSSDKGEGWGAVLNESLNSACVVFANDMIGSVPFVLHDGINGYVYHNGSIDDLYKKLYCSIYSKEKNIQISKNAYNTMLKTWNAKTATENLLAFIDSLNSNNNWSLDDGPCSIVK